MLGAIVWLGLWPGVLVGIGLIALWGGAVIGLAMKRKAAEGSS
jgi:hypothetical protein